MTISLEVAKKTAGDLKRFESDPHGVYIECEKQHLTLTEYLESFDPSEIKPDGSLVDGVDAFDRLLMAMDVRLSGPNAFTLEKLMATGTELLMPELIKREVEYGMSLASSTYKDLVATEIPMTGITDNPIYISEQNLDSAKARKDKSLAKRASTNKGGDFPVFTLQHREKSIVAGDYGRVIEAPYSMLRARAWPELRVFFHLLGAQLATDKLYDLYLLGISGDGTVGAATDLFNGSSGTLTYADLVHAYTSFGDPFEMNAILCPQQSYETILCMAQFQDPLAGWEFQKTGKPVTPMGASMRLVGTTPGGTPTGTKIVVIDKRFAVRLSVAQGLKVEADKIITRKFEEATISEESVFSVMADGAIRQIDWT